MNKSVKTPCIGVCSTGLGDDVCRGCKRFQHEVLQWNSYSDSEKISVLNRLEILKTQIMESKVFVFDEVLLKDHSYCWVFDLFRFASQSIADPSAFGFEIITKDTNNILILKKIIEEELFELSEAHYQRYFNLEDNFNA